MMQSCPKRFFRLAAVLAAGCIILTVDIVLFQKERAEQCNCQQELIDAGRNKLSVDIASLSTDRDNASFSPSVNTKRIEHLRDFCHNVPEEKDRALPWTSQRMVFLAVDSYKALYCMIPKTGSTSFKYLLMKLASGLDNVEHRKGIPALKRHNVTMVPPNTTAEEILSKFNSYTKILTVRDPLDRIVSAYKSKMIDRGDMTTSLIIHTKRILQRRHVLNMTDLNSHPVYKDKPTFEEFALYLTEVPHTDPHWMSQFSLSQPCTFQYDIINTVETMDTDLPIMLAALNAPQNITLRTANKSVAKQVNKTDDDHIRSLPPDLFKKLINAYKKDFKAFGYSIPSN